MGSDMMLPRKAYHKPFTVKFPDKRKWQNSSKTSKGTGAGMCRWGLRRGHRLNLRLHITVFQAEMYAIKACIMENIEKGYTGSNVYILSNS